MVHGYERIDVFACAASRPGGCDALAPAGPAWAQDDVTWTCPNGLRTVEDPISEAPNLACTNLFGANLGRADLTGARLDWSDLRRAHLYRADLSGASLSGADLRLAEMGRADLTGAMLGAADLSGADLSEANLTDANLYLATLYVANLAGANLSTALGLPTAILTGARYNPATKFPPGFDPAGAGMTLVSE